MLTDTLEVAAGRNARLDFSAEKADVVVADSPIRPGTTSEKPSDKRKRFHAIPLVLLLLAALILPLQAAARNCLAQDADYYVASGGSDTNDGSAAAPWATPTHAAIWVQQNLDLCSHRVTIYLSGDGCRPFTVVGPFVGARIPGSVRFVGNAVNPTLCRIVASSGAAIALWENAAVEVSGVQVDATGCATNQASGFIVSDSRLYLAGVWFGFACWAQVHALGNTTRVSWVGGNIVVVGSAGFGILAEDKAQVNFNGATVNFFASVGYTHAFAYADQASVIDFTGASFIYNGFGVYGRRYVSEQGALIRTGGNVLPGNAAGLVQTYGLVM